MKELKADTTARSRLLYAAALSPPPSDLSIIPTCVVQPNFGNAGAVESLIGRAKQRLASSGSTATEITPADLGIDLQSEGTNAGWHVSPVAES